MNSAEDLRKYLEILQATIERMGANSFLLKGWSITVGVAILTFVTSNKVHGPGTLLALLAALSFWGLDAYYLRQERLFRALFRAAAECSPSDTIPCYSMSTKTVTASVPSWKTTLLTPTVSLVHGTVALTSLALAFLTQNAVPIN